MPLFSKQKVFCNICGTEFLTNFFEYEGRVCGQECYKELDWRQTLSLMGKEYYPKRTNEVSDQ